MQYKTAYNMAVQHTMVREGGKESECGTLIGWSTNGLQAAAAILWMGGRAIQPVTIEPQILQGGHLRPGVWQVP